MAAAPLRVGAYYSTYSEFEEALKLYETKNFVLFRVTSSKGVSWANSRLQPEEVPYKSELRYKNVTLHCKSGGPERVSKSTGQRPYQRTLNIKCTAQISLLAENVPRQRLKVTIFTEKHNHLTTRGFVSLYPENRRLSEDEKAKAAEMISCRGRPQDIRSHLQNTTGKQVTAKDFSNLQQNIKKGTRKGMTDEEDLLAELNNLVAEDPGAQYKIGYVEENSNDLFEEQLVDFILFQTSQMKKNLKSFPEIIGMDTTYNTNKHNMHLVVMQVVDNHSNGRVVAYVLVRRETSQIVEAALATFAKYNEDIVPLIRTVLTDKDYREISGINNVLPNAHVHLCHTHVHRIFKRQIKEKDEPNREKVLAQLKKMSVSGNKEEFEKLYEEFCEMASETTKTYFDSYWKDIDSAWILYVRNNSLSLGIRSNQHVESHNEKIKRVVRRTMTLGDLVRELVKLHKAREFESTYKDFREIFTRAYIAHSKHPDVNQIYQTVTDWGAKLLVSELQKSAKLDCDILGHEDPSVCSCNFFKMFGLNHCQHIFYRRCQEGEELLHLSDLPTRWLKGVAEEESEDEEEVRSEPRVNSGNRVQVTRKTPLGPQVMDKRTKYKKALEVCSDISSVLSLTGGKQLEQRMEVLENILKYWMSKRECVVLPIGPDGVVETELLVQTTELEAEDEAEILDEATGNEAGEEAESGANTREKSHTQKCPDMSFPTSCKNCNTALPRKICERKPSRNYGRYFYSCGCKAGTGTYFRWEQCSTCHAKDVRQGHYEDINESLQLHETLMTSSNSVPTGRSQQMSASPSTPVFSSSSPPALKPSSEKNINDFVENIFHSEEGVDGFDASGGDKDSFLSPLSMSNIPDSDGEDHSDISGEYGERSKNRHIDSPSSISSLDKLLKYYDDQNPKKKTTVHISESSSVSSASSNYIIEGTASPSDEDMPPITSSQEVTSRKKLNLPQPRDAGRVQLKDDNEVATCRTKGLAIPDKDVQSINHNSWLVTSQSQMFKTYKVTERQQLCKISPCQGKLPPCPHLLNCTCQYFVIKKSVCKHIFKVFHFIILKRDQTSAHKIVVGDCNATSFILPSQKVQGVPRMTTNSTKAAQNLAKKKYRLSLSKPPTPTPPVNQTAFSGVTIRKKKEISPEEEPAAGTEVTCLASGKWRISCNGGATAFVTQKKNTCTQCADVEHACLHRFKCSCAAVTQPCVHIKVIHATYFPHEVTTERRSWLVGQNLLRQSNVDNLDAVKFSKPGNAALNPSQKRCKNCNVDSPQPGHKCCPICKTKNIRRGHLCNCVVCSKSISKSGSTCYRCTRPVHKDNCCYVEVAPEKNNALLTICKSCRITRDTGLKVAALRDLEGNKELTEEHLALASRFIKEKFPDIAGLAPPANIQRGARQIMIPYDVYQVGETYMQFIGTGRHWLLVIVHEDVVYLLDSLYNDELAQEVETQIATILNTTESTIEVNVPGILQQGNSVDCALHCIANAIQFATDRKIANTKYIECQLRPHWFKCIESGELSLFPSLSQTELLQTEMPYKDIQVLCICRLPDHYGTKVTKCSSYDCHEWFHIECMDMCGKEERQGNWYCPHCTSK